MNSCRQRFSIAVGSLLGVSTSKDVWCSKKQQPQFYLTQKLIFTFLWQKPGEFTGTLTALSESETLVLFLKRMWRTAGLLNPSVTKLAVCCSLVFVPWLSFSGHACWAWFLYPLAIGRWQDCAGRRALLLFLCHSEIQQMSFHRRTRKDRLDKSFFSRNYTFSPINHPQSCHDRLHWLN